MKVIMIVDLDDSFMPLDEDTIVLEKGTIKYRDINRNPFAITIEGLKLKPMPQKKYAIQGMKGYSSTVKECKGYNKCINEILGEQNDTDI